MEFLPHYEKEFDISGLVELASLLWPCFAAAIVVIGVLQAASYRRASKRGDYLDEQPDPLFWPILRTLVLSLACSVALLIGITRLRGELAMPERFWHWLPLIALGICLLGSPLSTCSFRWRILAWPILGLAAAWFLVPDWETLTPGRNVYVALLGIYFASLFWLYGVLSRTTPARETLFALTATASATSVAVAAVASLTYGNIAAMVAAGLAGGWAASWFVKLEAQSLTGLMPCSASMLGGIAFVGFVYPSPPIFELLLLPWAPAAMLVSLSHNRRGLVTRLAALCFVLAIAVIVILMRYALD